MDRAAPSRHRFDCLRLACRTIICSLAVALASTPGLAASPTRNDTELKELREQGRALEHGEGVAKDPAKAIALYCEGAKAGDPEAAYSLGWMYANGRGVARDDALAVFYFEFAVAKDHAPSRRMLRFISTPAAATPKCMQAEEDPLPTALMLNMDNEKVRKLVELIHQLAPEYGVKPLLALAIARTESNFNAAAVSEKNAQGLMQLIPETSVRFNVRKPFDPEQNIRGGLAYLRWLLAYFRGDVALVAAAYNSGEGTVNRYRGIPPYPETRDYVKRILGYFPREVHPYDEAITPPSPDIEQILRRKAERKAL